MSPPLSINTKAVLFVIDRIENPHAGTEGQLIALARGLDRAGYDVRVLVLEHSGFVETMREWLPVDVLGARRVSSVRTWWRLLVYALRARRLGYRLAHVFFNDASVICPPVFRLLGIRTLISRRDMGFWYTPLYIVALRAVRWSLSGVVANSEAVKRVTVDTEKIPPDNIHVIYNGYTAPAPGTRRTVAELETIVSCDDSKLAFLVANIRPIKRIEDAVTALAEVNGAGVPMRLCVVGGGDASALHAMATDLGVGDRVHFLGARDDVVDCLDYADCGLICSDSEGYSNAIVEYMYAGLPVVASDVGGNSEAVVHGRTGYLYPVGEVERLAGCLVELARNPVAAAAMGEAGRAMARERHDGERMLERHRLLYRRILSAGAEELKEKP